MRRASTSSAPRECCRAEARRHRETRSRHCSSTFGARRSLRSSLPSPLRCSTGPIIAGVTVTLLFHDLLVLARDALRHDDVRAASHTAYERILIDEFQDTDPLQVEIAVLLASSRPDIASREWFDDPLTPADAGRLFFVGDPKQSIYRFRRADVELYRQRARRVRRSSAAPHRELPHRRLDRRLHQHPVRLVDERRRRRRATRLRGADPARARPRDEPHRRHDRRGARRPSHRRGAVSAKPTRSCESSRRRSAKGG